MINITEKESQAWMMPMERVATLALPLKNRNKKQKLHRCGQYWTILVEIASFEHQKKKENRKRSRKKKKGKI